jgi:hypothetical protein|tara:strand:+ start:123 stop:329 length:207 start_codon:yes stop_codon:yes gene_type:complete
MDSLFNTFFVTGIPIIALLFGSLHWLASAHHTQLGYSMEKMSKQEIRNGTLEFANNKLRTRKSNLRFP